MRKHLLINTTILTVILGGSMPAIAGETEEKIKLLEAQMQMLMQEIKSLKASQKTVDEQVAEQVAESFSAMVPAAGNDVNITMKPSPNIESADGQYSFQPFGRVHLDYTVFDDDNHNHADNSDWRRARLGFKGKLAGDWKHKYEMDLADEDVAFREVYLRYAGFDAADLTIGHFKPFQGFEELTSSNYISLIERSAPTAVFARSYTTGISLQTYGEQWSVHLGAFGEAAGSTSDSDDEDTSVAARVAFVPVKNEDVLLHVGASGSIRNYRNDNNSLSLSTRGETGDGDKLLNTGTISGADDANVYGLELAGVAGNFHAQAEYFLMDVDRTGGSPNAEFDGWYVQAGYILTGEQRPYKMESGSFGRIKPNNPFSTETGGRGAWEVAGRCSNTDLNDSSAGISGGEMDIWTVGLNWYVNNHLRFMANFRSADTDANAVVADDDPQSFTIRTQFDF